MWVTLTRGNGSPSWLTGRRYVGTSPLGVPRMVYMCPPGGCFKSVSSHGGEEALGLGGKGGP